MRARVFVASYYDRNVVAAPLKRMASAAEVVLLDPAFGRSLSEDELIRTLPGFDVVVACDEQYTREIFEALPDLKMISRDGVGLDSVDLPAATEHGVIVTNAPVLHETAADFSFGLILAVCRKIPYMDRQVRKGGWSEHARFVGSDVHGKTLGILGFGRIGRTLAHRAMGFDMPVLAHDPYVEPVVALGLGARLVDFDELLGKSDILAVHTPLTPETYHKVDAQAIARMKDGAYLVNVSRGTVVDQDAVVSALRSGKLAGAALDVLNEEPPPIDSELFGMDNVVLTPHAASDTAEDYLRIMESVVDDILLFLRGDWPLHVVNPDVRDSVITERGVKT